MRRLGRIVAFGCELLLYAPVLTTGVGKDEDPCSDVRCSDIGSSKTIPLCIVPARGKVSEDSVETANSESCDIFNEHVLGS